MNDRRKSYPLRIRPKILSEMRDVAYSNNISLNKQIEQVLSSYLIRRKAKSIEVEVENVLSLCQLLDSGKVTGCGHCGSEFEEDDFAFAKETGGCPYCKSILTKVKFKED